MMSEAYFKDLSEIHTQSLVSVVLQTATSGTTNVKHLIT